MSNFRAKFIQYKLKSPPKLTEKSVLKRLKAKEGERIPRLAWWRITCRRLITGRIFYGTREGDYFITTGAQTFPMIL